MQSVKHTMEEKASEKDFSLLMSWKKEANKISS